MKRAVLYLRVSSDEQVRGTSLDSQEDARRRYCAANDLEIVKVFREKGESAKSDNRPLFQEMVAFCTKRQNRIDHAVVYKLDRFARNSTDYHVHAGALARADVTVRSATEPVGDDPVGQLLETILAGIAQFDNDIRGERSRLGMRGIAQRGGWCFRAPLGYCLARSPGGLPILEEDPATGPLVRKLFEAVASGRYTTVGLTEYAATLGLRGRTGKPLHVQTIHKMLRMGVYAGRIEGKLTDGRIVKAAFAPLVPEELYDRVQVVLAGQGHVPSPHLRNNPDFPLRRFVLCGSCGRPLTGSHATGRAGRRYPQYRCAKKACRAVNVRAEALEGAFMGLLKEIKIESSPLLQRFRQRVLEEWQVRHAEVIASAVGRWKAQAETLAKKQAVLLDRMLDGTVDEATYRTKNAELTQQIAVARVRYQEAAGDEFNIETALRLACLMVQNAGRLWYKMTQVDRRQRLQRALFPDGLVYHQEMGFGTAANTYPVEVLREFSADGSRMAPPRGIEPLFPG